MYTHKGLSVPLVLLSLGLVRHYCATETRDDHEGKEAPRDWASLFVCSTRMVITFGQRLQTGLSGHHFDVWTNPIEPTTICPPNPIKT